MVIRYGEPVAAGLSRLAQMGCRDRARVVRLVCAQCPPFRSLLMHVMVARGIAFASGLDLAVAIVLVAGGAPAIWVAVLVLCGMIGFGFAALILTDSRFDLLLAILGAHRTDELHERLVTEQIYGGLPLDARPSPAATHHGGAQRHDRTCCGLSLGVA